MNDLLPLARLVALAIIPFLFVPWLAEQRELPRHTLFQLVVFTTAALAIAHGGVRAPRRVQAAAFAFLLCLLISCAAAESPLRSWFGPYEGHTGALTWCAYVVLLLVPPRPEWLPRFLVVLAALGTLQAGLGVGDVLSGAPASGSIGHPAFFAAFVMIGTLAAVGLALRVDRLRLRVPLALCAGLQVAALALSGRRGPALGLALGLAIIALASIKPRKVLAMAAGIAVVFGITIMLRAGPDYEPRPVDRWSKLFEDRAVPANIDTVNQRTDFYRVAGEVALDRPLVGWGFGTFRDHYARYKQEAVARFETREHNLALELAVALGLPGLALFLVLVGVLFVQARRRFGEQPLLVVVVAIVASYLVHLLFSFDQPAIGAWVWSLAAFTVPVVEPALAPRFALRSCVAGALVALPLIAVIARPLADHAMVRGLNLEESGLAGEAIEQYRRGVRIAPHECLYALKLTAALNAIEKRSSSEERIELMSRCAELEPRNAFVRYHLGLALAPVSERPTLLERSLAIRELHLATELAPHAAVFRQGLAQALATFGDPEAALVEIDRALALDPGRPGYVADRENIVRILLLRRPVSEASLR